MPNKDDSKRHCYRVRLPSEAEARRLLGIETVPGYTPREEGDYGILCGALGTPCYHCGGIPDALCDFPLGDEGRTCDRSLCLKCAPNIGLDGRPVPLAQQLPEADYKNYCREHDEHGRNMLLFPRQARQAPHLRAPSQRAKPLPKAPPETHRYRVRQGSDGAGLTGWKTEFEAHRFARRVGGYVETWEEFVKLWRDMYPLKKRR